MNKSVLSVCISSLFLTGCISETAKPDDPHYAPVVLEASRYSPEKKLDGAIYQSDHGMQLFYDRRAHKIGDILTVTLIEVTSASQSEKTNLSKTSNTDIDAPKLPFMRSLADANADLGATSSFKGNGNSKQANSLTGSITVTVTEVLPNGNLVIRGEKWMNLRGGDEFIRISGIIRPVDIAANNTVNSDRIANARITFKSKGQIAESNQSGWWGRFFRSIISPF